MISLALHCFALQLSGRRLLNLGGTVTPKGLLPAPIPKWLQPVMGRLGDQNQALTAGLYGGRPPNHALVNAYRPGEGIMVSENDCNGAPPPPGDPPRRS